MESDNETCQNCSEVVEAVCPNCSSCSGCCECSWYCTNSYCGKVGRTCEACNCCEDCCECEDKQAVFLQALCGGQPPQQAHYGAASYSLLQLCLSFVAKGLELHSLVGIRENEVTKGNFVKEIHLSPMSLAYMTPLFPDVRYCFTKTQDGETKFLVQEDNAKAYRLAKGMK
jgi:hypothetical protein